MNSPISLVPSKSDAELANEIKNELAEAYDPIFKILDKAMQNGFHIHLETGLNAFGKNVIAKLIVAKHF